MKLQVILEPSDEGGYTVFVPALPGCISEGDNIDRALAKIQEAMRPRVLKDTAPCPKGYRKHNQRESFRAYRRKTQGKRKAKPSQSPSETMGQ